MFLHITNRVDSLRMIDIIISITINMINSNKCQTLSILKYCMSIDIQTTWACVVFLWYTIRSITLHLQWRIFCFIENEKKTEKTVQSSLFHVVLFTISIKNKASHTHLMSTTTFICNCCFMCFIIRLLRLLLLPLMMLMPLQISVARALNIF